MSKKTKKIFILYAGKKMSFASVDDVKNFLKAEGVKSFLFLDAKGKQTPIENLKPGRRYRLLIPTEVGGDFSKIVEESILIKRQRQMLNFFTEEEWREIKEVFKKYYKNLTPLQISGALHRLYKKINPDSTIPEYKFRATARRLIMELEKQV
ncbi:MAG: hypothetical protein QXO40_00025 [Candidatus Aenigmatarchaeota archaeon]